MPYFDHHLLAVLEELGVDTPVDDNDEFEPDDVPDDGYFDEYEHTYGGTDDDEDEQRHGVY